jgi:pyruvate dehydrogenase E2 component (dihydrolipoamide acetyltransferase)
MESATLSRWMVGPGDVVRRGDVVAAVETSKGIIDIEIFQEGRIDELLVTPGTRVPVGAPLARYTPATGERPETAAAPAAATSTRKARVSPAARRRARELGVALDRLPASGPQGSVTVADVERSAMRGGPPDDGMRAVIGRAMSRSKREIPHYYLATTVDLGPATALVERWNAGHPVTERLLIGALFVKAVALALENHRGFNGHFIDGRFQARDDVVIGIAIRLRQGGLLAPGLPAANRLPLADVMRQLQSLVQRARAGHLRQSEVTNATITVSSLGEDGVEALYPIIHPPQVAIVGFGGIVSKPWARDGSIVLAPLVTATLSADHRASDGHLGSLFLGEIARILQQPERL